MKYNKEIKIGDLVTAKQTYTMKKVKGEFAGYVLEDKSRPDNVVGQILDREGQNLYNVDVESIEIAEDRDEKMLRVICLALTDVSEQRFSGSGTTLKECIQWLEHISDPIIQCVSQATVSAAASALIDEKMKELESIINSSAPLWKPSKEQMKRLNNVIIADRGIWGFETKKAMESLYDDLKKLMDGE